MSAGFDAAFDILLYFNIDHATQLPCLNLPNRPTTLPELLSNHDDNFLESPITTVIQNNPGYLAEAPSYTHFPQMPCNVNMYSFVKSEQSGNFLPCLESSMPYHHECKGSFCFVEHGPQTPQSSHYSTNSPPSQSSLASPESCVDFEFSLSSTSSAESPDVRVVPNDNIQLCSTIPAVPLKILNEDYSNRYELYNDMMFSGLPYMEYPIPSLTCYVPFEHQEQQGFVNFAPNPDDFLVNPLCMATYSKQIRQQTRSPHIH